MGFMKLGHYIGHRIGLVRLGLGLVRLGAVSFSSVFLVKVKWGEGDGEARPLKCGGVRLAHRLKRRVGMVRQIGT